MRGGEALGLLGAVWAAHFNASSDWKKFPAPDERRRSFAIGADRSVISGAPFETTLMLLRKFAGGNQRTWNLLTDWPMEVFRMNGVPALKMIGSGVPTAVGLCRRVSMHCDSEEWCSLIEPEGSAFVEGVTIPSVREAARLSRHEGSDIMPWILLRRTSYPEGQIWPFQSGVDFREPPMQALVIIDDNMWVNK
jgi:hypothetical protein